MKVTAAALVVLSLLGWAVQCGCDCWREDCGTGDWSGIVIYPILEDNSVFLLNLVNGDSPAYCIANMTAAFWELGCDINMWSFTYFPDPYGYSQQTLAGNQPLSTVLVPVIYITVYTRDNCLAGSYGEPGKDDCTLCPAGTYNPDPGSTSPDDCTSCPAGTYSSHPGASSCTPCPAGTYSSTTGATYCAFCLAGTLCLAGSSSPTPCPAGEYCPSPSSSNGFQCPVGNYCPIGSPWPILCPVGSYCDSEGSPLPTPCPPGTYFDGSATGASSSSVCIQCAEGTYTPYNSTRSCGFCDFAGSTAEYGCQAELCLDGNADAPQTGLGCRLCNCLCSPFPSSCSANGDRTINIVRLSGHPGSPNPFWPAIGSNVQITVSSEDPLNCLILQAYNLWGVPCRSEGLYYHNPHYWNTVVNDLTNYMADSFGYAYDHPITFGDSPYGSHGVFGIVTLNSPTTF